MLPFTQFTLIFNISFSPTQQRINSIFPAKAEIAAVALFFIISVIAEPVWLGFSHSTPIISGKSTFLLAKAFRKASFVASLSQSPSFGDGT